MLNARAAVQQTDTISSTAPFVPRLLGAPTSVEQKVVAAGYGRGGRVLDVECREVWVEILEVHVE